MQIVGFLLFVLAFLHNHYGRRKDIFREVVERSNREHDERASEYPRYKDGYGDNGEVCSHSEKTRQMKEADSTKDTVLLFIEQ